MTTHELKIRAAERYGVYEERDGNGQMKERRTYKDGKLDGLRETWYENGQMKERSNYKAGKLDGLYEWWDENGQMWGHVSYKDGRVVAALPVAPDDRGTPAPRPDETVNEN